MCLHCPSSLRALTLHTSHTRATRGKFRRTISCKDHTCKCLRNPGGKQGSLVLELAWHFKATRGKAAQSSSKEDNGLKLSRTTEELKHKNGKNIFVYSSIGSSSPPGAQGQAPHSSVQFVFFLSQAQLNSLVDQPPLFVHQNQIPQKQSGSSLLTSANTKSGPTAAEGWLYSAKRQHLPKSH